MRNERKNEARSGMDLPRRASDWHAMWDEIRQRVGSLGVETIDIAEFWRALPKDVRTAILREVNKDPSEAAHRSYPIEELERLVERTASSCFDRERVKGELRKCVEKGPELMFSLLSEPNHSLVGGEVLADAINATKIKREIREYVMDNAIPEVAKIAVRYAEEDHEEVCGLLCVISVARGVFNRFLEEFRDQLVQVLTRLALEVLREAAPGDVYELIEDATDSIRQGFRSHAEYTSPSERTVRAWLDTFLVGLDEELEKARGLVSGVWYVLDGLEQDFFTDRVVAPEIWPALARIFDRS